METGDEEDDELADIPFEKMPDLKPDIPDAFLDGMSKKERWLFEQASISGKQNRWIMARQIRADRRNKIADRRMTRIESRVGVIEDLKKILTARWSVVAYVLAGIVCPFLVGLLGAWVKSKF